MKIRIDVDISFRHPEHEEPQIHRLPSKIYTINNHEQLKATIDKMASDIEIKIENSQLRKSGYHIKKIDKGQGQFRVDLGQRIFSIKGVFNKWGKRLEQIDGAHDVLQTMSKH